MPADYYRDVLYPLQDKALAAFRGSPFYLSGGTALSRGYYHHRYSGDLALFLNDAPDFPTEAEQAVGRLQGVFEEFHVAARDARSYRMFAGHENLIIDLVNDVPEHIGPIVEIPGLGRVDSRENILASKITALIDRPLPQDIADLYVLLQDGRSLKRALTDASSNTVGITPLLLAKILMEFDYTLLDHDIQWITPPPGDEVRKYLQALAGEIVQASQSPAR